MTSTPFRPPVRLPPAAGGPPALQGGAAGRLALHPLPAAGRPAVRVGAKSGRQGVAEGGGGSLHGPHAACMGPMPWGSRLGVASRK